MNPWNGNFFFFFVASMGPVFGKLREMSTRADFKSSLLLLRTFPSWLSCWSVEPYFCLTSIVPGWRWYSRRSWWRPEVRSKQQAGKWWIQIQGRRRNRCSTKRSTTSGYFHNAFCIPTVVLGGENDWWALQRKWKVRIIPWSRGLEMPAAMIIPKRRKGICGSWSWCRSIATSWAWQWRWTSR